MPDFLDFVFPFGKQQYAQDFHFSGFRHDTRLSRCQPNLSIPELGWSGRDLQLCYNLKSVEPSKSQSKWPWSIRQSAVYHAFDIGSSRATWIVMKGDQLMKNRIKSATGTRGLPEVSSFETVDRAFASTLATHMLLCDWSSEHWRWYINFLEEELQATTRRILSVTVKEFLSPTSEEYPSPITQRSLTQMTQMTGRLASPASEKAAARSCEVIKEKSPGVPALPPDMPTFPELPIGSADQPQAGSQPEFSFSDLQRIQIKKQKLAGGGSATTYKITLHPDYNQLSPNPNSERVSFMLHAIYLQLHLAKTKQDSNDQHANTFVLKTYGTKDAEKYYTNEVGAFRKIRHAGRDPSIIRFYGSFIQDGTYNIILEYADMGTLENYFERTTPPSRGEDIIQFWRRIFSVLGALMMIHGMKHSNAEGPQIFQGYYSSLGFQYDSLIVLAGIKM